MLEGGLTRYLNLKGTGGYTKGKIGMMIRLAVKEEEKVKRVETWRGGVGVKGI